MNGEPLFPTLRYVEREHEYDCTEQCTARAHLVTTHPAIEPAMWVARADWRYYMYGPGWPQRSRIMAALGVIVGVIKYGLREDARRLWRA